MRVWFSPVHSSGLASIQNEHFAAEISSLHGGVVVTGNHSMRLPHERRVEETVLFDSVSMIDVILVCVVMMGSLKGSVVGSAVLVEVASRGDVVGDE